MERGELLRRSAQRAWLRERFTAPAGAIRAYADMLVEDAKGRSLDLAFEDLARIRECAQRVVEHLGAVEELMALGADAPDAALAHVRHDIRTPLTTIKGYTELLIEDEVDLDRTDLERLLHATDDFIARLAILGTQEPNAPHSPADTPALADAADRLVRFVTTAAPGRLLVIEDDADSRELLCELLRRGGHEVAAAGSGPEGLDRLRAGGIELVLLDLIMPGMNGFEVLEAMRADPDLAEAPVIVVSGLDDAVGIGRCLQAGAQDVLRKPYDAQILNVRVATNLDRKRLRDRERLALERIAAEKQTADALLHNILPAALVGRLSRGERMTAERLESATVLFADIVGFTSIAASLPPATLIADLDRIVCAFDDLALALGVEKIKTVGDAYVAAAGVPDARPDHAVMAARLALAMTAHLTALAAELNADYRLRIGVHSGPLLAGVIGKHKFTYDIWGDSVNIAARLQTTAAPGEIWVSATTRALLGPEFTLQPRGIAELRGRGRIEVHALLDGPPD